MPAMQCILLCEYYARFRGRHKEDYQPSSRFLALCLMVCRLNHVPNNVQLLFTSTRGCPTINNTAQIIGLWLPVSLRTGTRGEQLSALGYMDISRILSTTVVCLFPPQCPWHVLPRATLFGCPGSGEYSNIDVPYSPVGKHDTSLGSQKCRGLGGY